MKCRCFCICVLLMLFLLSWFRVLGSIKFVPVSCAVEEVHLYFVFLIAWRMISFDFTALVFYVVSFIYGKSSIGRNFEFQFARPSVVSNFELILEVLFVHRNQRFNHFGVQVIFLLLILRDISFVPVFS